MEPLAFLLGTWRGGGQGEYPTIEPFAYSEETLFWHVGKPFLAYSQRAGALEDESLLHSEMGYWLNQSTSDIELVLAQPGGRTEIEIGALTGKRVDLVTQSIGRTATAKEVSRVERSMEVVGDLLVYDLRMAAVGIPLTHHVHAELRRVEP